jgi:NTP pyrophosphatase (non-canonical NTP hydrolase)
MNSKEYLEGVLKTESADFNAIVERIGERRIVRLLHAAMGLSTEAGEFQDVLKKYVFYGKELDEINLLEECGDLLWYLGIAIHELNSSFEAVMASNHAKLAFRYKDKFSQREAMIRSLMEERRILEESGSPPVSVPGCWNDCGSTDHPGVTPEDVGCCDCDMREED